VEREGRKMNHARTLAKKNRYTLMVIDGDSDCDTITVVANIND